MKIFILPLLGILLFTTGCHHHHSRLNEHPQPRYKVEKQNRFYGTQQRDSYNQRGRFGDGWRSGS
ncbi:MAG: hypothetical protein HQM04_19055 [Magnetococcales bacterium]|nr:hypothetical protein [Magnetococcales bacterium]MBF0117127.1 hypothetical protein [Magnetococcales bacterium]